MDVGPTVDLIGEKKMGIEQDLNEKILGKGIGDQSYKGKKSGYWTNRRFDLKNYEKDGGQTNRRLDRKNKDIRIRRYQ